MNKKFILYAVVWCVCCIIFNALTFLTPVAFNVVRGGFWTGYVFILIAFVGQLACGYAVLGNESPQKTFYNVLLIIIVYACLAMMLVSGAICMIVPFVTIRRGAAICVTMLGISVIAVLAARFAVGTISETDEEIMTKSFMIRSLTAEAEHLVSSASDSEVRAESERIYDALRYSDPISSTALADIDGQIQKQFKAFEESANAGDHELCKANADSLISLLDKRNKQCRLKK